MPLAAAAASREPQVLQAQPDNQARTVVMVTLVRMAPRVTMLPKTLSIATHTQPASAASPEPQEQQAHLDPRELQETLVPQEDRRTEVAEAHLELLGLPDLPVCTDILESEVPLAPLAKSCPDPVLLGHQDLLAPLVYPDLLDPLELQASHPRPLLPDLRESQEMQVFQARTVFLVELASQETAAVMAAATTAHHQELPRAIRREPSDSGDNFDDKPDGNLQFFKAFLIFQLSFNLQ